MDGWALLEAAGRKRGFLISGGEVDLERTANILLDEFRGGKLGRITLEWPGDMNTESDTEPDTEKEHSHGTEKAAGTEESV